MTDFNGRNDSQTIYGSASYFANDANFQVALSNHFEIYIKGLGRGSANGVFSGKEAFDSAYESIENIVSGEDAIGEILRMNVSSFTVPEVSVSQITLQHGNDRVKVAGGVEVGDATITVKDVIGADTERMLWAWLNLVYDAEHKTMGLAADYKKEGLIYQFAPDGTSVRTWKCVGLWPTSMPTTSLAYDSSNNKEIEITLSCDNIYLIRDGQALNAPNYAFTGSNP